MKLFKMQSDLTSYTYPALKIAVCLIIILFSVLRNRIFHCSNQKINALVAILCLALAIASILCLYISVGELFYTYSNRKHIETQIVDSLNVKQFPTEKITDLVQENDIIEIEIIGDGNTVKIGASAD